MPESPITVVDESSIDHNCGIAELDQGRTLSKQETKKAVKQIHERMGDSLMCRIELEKYNLWAMKLYVPDTEKLSRHYYHLIGPGIPSIGGFLRPSTGTKELVNIMTTDLSKISEIKTASINYIIGERAKSSAEDRHGRNPWNIYPNKVLDEDTFNAIASSRLDESLSQYVKDDVHRSIEGKTFICNLRADGNLSVTHREVQYHNLRDGILIDCEIVDESGDLVYPTGDNITFPEFKIRENQSGSKGGYWKIDDVISKNIETDLVKMKVNAVL